MTGQNQDDMTTKVASLTEEFPGYQFSWTENDSDHPDGRYRLSAQEAESWSNGEIQTASGDTIEAAIEGMRAKMRGGNP